jgi:hypothetical protein
MRSINLILALFWLMLGVLLLLDPYVGAKADPGWFIRIGKSQVPVGWLCLLLALYNSVRWWMTRHSRAARWRQREVARREELKRRLRSSKDVEKAVDPNFQFTDQPPPPA